MCIFLVVDFDISKASFRIKRTSASHGKGRFVNQWLTVCQRISESLGDSIQELNCHFHIFSYEYGCWDFLSFFLVDLYIARASFWIKMSTAFKKQNKGQGWETSNFGIVGFRENLCQNWDILIHFHDSAKCVEANGQVPQTGLLTALFSAMAFFLSLHD